MDPVILIIGGIVLFIVAINVFAAVMSRGMDNLFKFGAKKIGKKHNDEIDKIVAVPLVMTSPASVAEIMGALDAIVAAAKSAPPLGAAVYEVSREPDKITYALGNKIYPQSFVAEVRFGERDGATQVVFKCLHLTEKDGMRPGADALAVLRDSVECAVGAAGDPEKVAHGVKLYGPPEPGSPRALRMRNAKILTWTGGALILIPVAVLGAGMRIRDIPMYAVMGAIGGALVWLATRMERRTAEQREAELAGAPVDTVIPEAAVKAATGVMNAAADAMPVAVDAVDKARQGAGRAVTAFNGLSGRNKLIAVVLALVLLTAVGFSVSGGAMGDGGGEPDGYESAYDNPGGTGGDYTPTDYVSDDVAYDDGEQTAIEEDNASNPSLTRNGNSRYMGASDVTYYGAADGSSKHAIVTYVGGSGYDDSEMLALEVEGLFLSADEAGHVYDVQLWADDLGDCFIDTRPVAASEFLAFVNSRSETLGGIDYTKDAVVTLNAYHDDFVPADGY